MYSITKDPLSLGIIGLMGYPCCFYGFVCWPHSGSERKEKLISQMHFGFSVISFGLFLLTWPAVVQDYSLRTILYSIYFLVFLGD
jgi:hypothetical protein